MCFYAFSFCGQVKVVDGQLLFPRRERLFVVHKVFKQEFLTGHRVIINVLNVGTFTAAVLLIICAL